MVAIQTIPAPDVPLRERLLFTLLRRPVIRFNARFGRFDEEVIWLLGHPRSGTTWVAELINHDHRLRDMFEPIRPARVEQTSFLRPHQYARPGDDDAELHQLMTEIFAGRLTHARVDFANRRPLYTGLIVKDCFANLLAGWVGRRFPTVRPVLLIRNPFAACLSMLKRPRWYWPIDPADLLAQRDLVEDHLAPFHDTLARTAAEGDDLDKALVTWAVVNLVPLRQFAVDELHVCLYEEFYHQPEDRLAGLLEFTSRADPADLDVSREQIDTPSRMGKNSNVTTDKSPVSAWRDDLGAERIERGVTLLDELGVGDLYGDGLEPDRAVLDRLRRT